MAEEGKAIEAEIASLTARLEAIRSAVVPIESLLKTGAYHVSPGEPEEAEESPNHLTLQEAIRRTLLGNPSPMYAVDIAKELLSEGYETSSGDFPNVVGTTLRKLKNEKFAQDEQGRWYVIGRPGNNKR